MNNTITASNHQPVHPAHNDSAQSEKSDYFYVKLNPDNVTKDIDIAGILSTLIETKPEQRQYIAESIRVKLPDATNESLFEGKWHIKNDVVLLSYILGLINDTSLLSPAEIFRIAAVFAIKQDAMNGFDENKTFSIDDNYDSERSREKNEANNFNRVLSTLHLASINFGYLGKKILFEGTKQIKGIPEMLKGDNAEKRHEKLINVIFDRAPSHQASTEDYGDSVQYYYQYCENYPNIHKETLEEDII